LKKNKTFIKDSMTRIRNQKKKDQNINTKDRKKPICNFLGSIEKRKRKKKDPLSTNL